MIRLNCFVILIFFGLFSGCSPKVINPIDERKQTSDTASDKVFPAQVFDLSTWKLTLPVNTEHNGNPDEIKQPELAIYTGSWFFLNKKKNAVVFRANAGGETTSGSNYPRSELREMTNNGTKSASWSSAVGTHTLYIDQRVTHLPDVRKHIVVGQIHDAERYVIFFRLEDRKLLVSINGGAKITLDPAYVLGTRFTVMFKVSDNKTQCFYNGDLKHTYEGSFKGAYFKAGAYVQSSCKGNKKVEGESCRAYGEVEIFETWVRHQ